MYLFTIFEEMCWEDKIYVTFSGPLALKDNNGQWLVKKLMRFLLKSTCIMEKYYLKKCREFFSSLYVNRDIFQK